MDAPLAAALVLLIVFSAITALVRRRYASHAPAARGHERSSAILGAMHGASMLSGVVFPSIGVADLPIPAAIAWAAVVCMALAYSLQVRAMTTLGAFFTLSLVTTPDQPIIDRGPYRWVRHPGYLGQLLTWLAFGVATRNAIALAVVVVGAPLAYVHRIRVEERMLANAFDERYDAYARGRARLLPGIW